MLPSCVAALKQHQDVEGPLGIWSRFLCRVRRSCVNAAALLRIPLRRARGTLRVRLFLAIQDNNRHAA